VDGERLRLSRSDYDGCFAEGGDCGYVAERDRVWLRSDCIGFISQRSAYRHMSTAQLKRVQSIEKRTYCIAYVSALLPKLVMVILWLNQGY
jgi:hypothetical protein